MLPYLLRLIAQYPAYALLIAVGVISLAVLAASAVLPLFTRDTETRDIVHWG